MRRPISLALTGDVMLGRHVGRVVPRRGFASPWGNLLPVFERADLLLINLECALTSETVPWHDGAFKAFYFRAAPDVVQSLTAARVSFASIANNHIGDFGITGLLDTVRVLDEQRIAHAGAGRDIQTARTPARLYAGDWRIAVVAAADYPAEWEAAADRPGINYIPVSLEHDALTKVQHQLEAARDQSDLVIFTIHWGPNMNPRPSSLFRQFARKVIDAGADVFWGHSAHVVQGVEFYRGRVILFDTGDFVDDYAVDAELRNDLSGLFLLQVAAPDSMRLQVVPVAITDMQVMLAEGAERDWLIRRFGLLCDELGSAVSDAEGQLAIEVFPKHSSARE